MFFHGTLSSKNPYGAISNTYFKARAVKTTRKIFLDPAQNHRIYSFPNEALNRWCGNALGVFYRTCKAMLRTAPIGVRTTTLSIFMDDAFRVERFFAEEP